MYFYHQKISLNKFKRNFGPLPGHVPVIQSSLRYASKKNGPRFFQHNLLFDVRMLLIHSLKSVRFLFFKSGLRSFKEHRYDMFFHEGS